MSTEKAGFWDHDHKLWGFAAIMLFIAAVVWAWKSPLTTFAGHYLIVLVLLILVAVLALKAHLTEKAHNTRLSETQKETY